MSGLLEMYLMRCLIESAARENGRKLVCSVCRTYGGTMYRRGDGYICRDCRRKKVQNE